MFIRATRSHINYLLNRRSCKITFLILFIIMLLNFFGNVMDFKGYDIVAMYHPMKILSLSYNRVFYNADTSLLIVQLFPLLVSWPAGLCLAIDKDTGADTVLICRLGKKIYYASKLVATVIVTSIIFSLPFLLEIVLNCISFPLLATGDLTNYNAYNAELIQMTDNYPMKSLYSISSYLYAIVGTMNFGLFAGLMAGLTSSISIVFRVKYRVFLIIPVFLLLHISSSLSSQKIKWFNYVLLFNSEVKSKFFLIAIGILIALFCLFCVSHCSKKDLLK